MVALLCTDIKLIVVFYFQYLMEILMSCSCPVTYQFFVCVCECALGQA